MAKEYRVAAGKLRHFIAIEQPVEVRDTQGGVSRTWAQYVIGWAEIIALTASEDTVPPQVRGKATHAIRTRYAVVTPEMRVVFRGRHFNITGVQDIDERGKVLTIYATERVA